MSMSSGFSEMKNHRNMFLDENELLLNAIKNINKN